MAYNIHNGTKWTSTGRISQTSIMFHGAKKSAPAVPALQMSKPVGTPLPKQHKFNRFSIQSVKRTINPSVLGKLDKGFGRTMAVRQIRKVIAVSNSLEYQGAGVWA